MSTISAGTTSNTALKQTGDVTGELVLQTNGTTTAMTISTAQVVSLTSSLALLGSTSGSVKMTAPAVAGTQAYTLPSALPTASGASLQCTTAGVMSWGSAAPTAPTSVEYLVVAGGGGGGGSVASGYAAGGGGGAGGYKTSTLSVSSGTGYTVTVGGGGTAGNGTTYGGNGWPSVFASITSTGGGGGANNNGVANGASGGSGGGASGSGGTGGPGTVGEGNAGGSVTNNVGGGPGGGGAGFPGGSLVSSFSGANGGDGLASNITTGAATVTYAGGGGGGALGGTAGSGGSGGGGAGAVTSGTGVSGTANTGGGGGSGGGTGSATTGGAGGSGVVIIAYPSTNTALASIGAGLTYTVDTTTRSGYRVYRFTAGTGTISW